MDLFARIRRDAWVKGLSVRALAARHGVHRRTVRQALESATPPERKSRQGVSWRLEPFKAAIDAVLTEDTTAPRKQRNTAKRILARLIEEHGAEELSFSTVRDYVRVRRAQIDVELHRRCDGSSRWPPDPVPVASCYAMKTAPSRAPSASAGTAPTTQGWWREGCTTSQTWTRTDVALAVVVPMLSSNRGACGTSGAPLASAI